MSVLFTYLKYFFERNHVDSEVNATTLIELIGIRMAATSGDILPMIAIVKPTTLYRRLTTNVILTIVIASFVKEK